MGAAIFNDMEVDAIGEIMNISLGASATAVSALLGAKVNITTPKVRIQNRDSFEFRDLEPAVGVEIGYTEGLEGRNIMLFSRDDVRVIVSMMMGEEIPADQFEMNEINESAIREVMNQMMGASSTALSEFLGTAVNISTPVSYEAEDEESFKQKFFRDNVPYVIVRFTLEIEERLSSEFLNIMPVPLVKRLLEPFREQLESETENAERAAQPEPPRERPESETESTGSPAQPEPPREQPESETESAGSPAQPERAGNPLPAERAWEKPELSRSDAVLTDPAALALLGQLQQSQSQMLELIREMKNQKTEPERKPSGERAVIRPLNAGEFLTEEEHREENQDNREMLMKVPLEISVEIGRTRKLVRDILEFTQGSLVVLDKMAGEQADLYVNGECIARGDIVVVEDNFGIRITEILKKDMNKESL